MDSLFVLNISKLDRIIIFFFVLFVFVHTGCLRSAKAFSIRNQSTMQVQDKNPRIFTAVCVQRSLVVTKMKSHLEVAYQKFQDQLELEHSALSEDEVQLEEFLQRKKKLKDDDDENMTIGIFEADRKVRCIVWPELINIQTAKTDLRYIYP